MVSDSAVYRKAKEGLRQRLLSGRLQQQLADDRARLEADCLRSQWGQLGIGITDIYVTLGRGYDEDVRSGAITRLAEAVVDGWRISREYDPQLNKALATAIKVEDDLTTRREVKLQAAKCGVIEAADDLLGRPEIRVGRWIKWNAPKLDQALRHLDAPTVLHAFWTLSIKRAEASLAMYLPADDDEWREDKLANQPTLVSIESPEYEESILHGLLTEPDEPDELGRIATTQAIDNALGQSGPREREVIRLLLACDMDTGLVAAALGISQTTVRVHRLNFRKRLTA